MVSQLDRGLFKLDFTDHHAVLGVAVDAEVKEIRKRYLTIARRLHPDSGAAASETEKQQAIQLLSKLVNPAWEKLSSDRDRAEYLLLLKLKGQQAIRQQASLDVKSEIARQLLAAGNPASAYKNSLQELAEKQYQDFRQVSEITAQISELNMVYLMRKESSGESITTEPKPVYTSGTTSSASPAASANSTSTQARSAAPPPPPPKPESMVEQYYRRAEAFAAKNNFAKAILELRDALQIEPNNSRCHSLMGLVYLKQNQPTMARIHFNQALKVDPKDPMALEGKQALERREQQKAGTKGTPSSAATKPAKPQDKSGGGGLFGMFGGKKK